MNTARRINENVNQELYNAFYDAWEAWNSTHERKRQVGNTFGQSERMEKAMKMPELRKMYDTMNDIVLQLENGLMLLDELEDVFQNDPTFWTAMAVMVDEEELKFFYLINHGDVVALKEDED